VAGSGATFRTVVGSAAKGGRRDVKNSRSYAVTNWKGIEVFVIRFYEKEGDVCTYNIPRKSKIHRRLRSEGGWSQ
jgi:hypothetical protein